MSSCNISLAVLAASSRTFELYMPESVVGDSWIRVAVAMADNLRNLLPGSRVHEYCVGDRVAVNEGRMVDLNEENKL